MMSWNILKTATGQEAIEGTDNFFVLPDYVEVAFRDVGRS